MANNCGYDLLAVSKDKSSLERLIKIMKYEDHEYFIYRCFEVCEDDIEEKEGLYFVHLYGDVAWSCNSWFENIEDKERIITHFKDGVETIGTAHYISLDILCKRLDIGIELYSEEEGCEFQEHYHINHKGEEIEREVVDWIHEWYDEEDNELEEPIIKGGFDNYMEYKEIKEIYGD